MNDDLKVKYHDTVKNFYDNDETRLAREKTERRISMSESMGYYTGKFISGYIVGYVIGIILVSGSYGIL